MQKLNEFWSQYILRLRRETYEYRYGSEYNHYWNEVYEIKNGQEFKSRGETIRINDLTFDKIDFTFFDEVTPSNGISDSISLSEPKVCLRGISRSGGSNEFAWAERDTVTLTLEKKQD